jgi:pyruvate/2-oxoglutarate dehydrogenase complex dihydrolipoamide acyltransferase (E2) component
VPPEESGPQQTNKPFSERAVRRAIFEQEYDGGAMNHGGQPASDDPDLTLDIPSLEVEELNLDVENLRARISLHAELADMVKLNVGLEADVDKVKLEAKGVKAQLLLKAGLDNVRAVLSQALDALDNNPEILEDLIRDSAETAGGSERALEGAAGTIGDTPERGADEDTEDRETGTEDAVTPAATDAARRKAEELGIDLSQVEGTGSGGRILLRDVKKAA